MKSFNRIIIFVVIILGLSTAPFFGYSEDLESICQQLTESTSGCPGMSSNDCKVLLEKCSDYYDELSGELEQDITKTTQQKNTLSNQIYSLKKKIQNLEYQINQSTVKVKGLNVQIEDTQESIYDTVDKIDDSRFQIKSILRSIYEEDKKPAIEILFEGSLSDFFSNLVYLESLNSKINDLLENTRSLQSYLQNQKVKMDGEVDQLQKTIVLQNLQKQENEQNRQQQQEYLNLTEAQYQQQLKEKSDLDSKAAKIRALLFSIVGVADTEAPTFGEAIEIAKSAAGLAGVRPAFLLAIISQESAIGRNVGQCMLVDTSTGTGKRISTGATVIRVMKPTRDVQPFLQITETLGRDPYNTPVSCWITAYVSGQPYGWGGAMGPAQFIPSTWKLFEGRLQSLLGRTPDPWGIKDSFTASALYLADLGATAQTTSAEKNAASRYYGGSSAYANSVSTRTNCIQTFMDSGTMSAYCEALIF